MSQEQVNIKTPEFVSIQFKTAGLGSRSAAFLIDIILLALANLLIFIVTMLIVSGSITNFLFGDVGMTTLAIMVIVLFVLNWGYFFVMEFFAGGKTVGKRLIGIRVIQDNGHSITLLSSFIRNFLRIIDSLPANYFVGMVMVFFHSNHKRLGDIVAGTMVVHERKKKSQKLSSLEKELKRRNLTKEDFVLEDWQIKLFTEKDWTILKTYSNRLLQLPSYEKSYITRQTASLFLNKLDVMIDTKNESELEDLLLVLFIHLREEWEYEL